ncbi:MAG TPA: MmgE/PrpD family protein [Burkholderiales bacterium]
MTTAITADLGRFVAALRFEDIPAAAVDIIAMAFTDCIGVTIAGASEPAPQLLRKMLAPAGGEAMLVGGGHASALHAAWINGTAAHALDYDDVAQRGGHPSTYLVWALLAAGETLAPSGRDLITAYAAGYETFAELIRRDADEHHAKGWHPTGIFGAIASAAACARLLGLDAQRAATAIALAASQSGGLVANFGSMAKPMHAGLAAHAGVASARLAQLGFTASLDALEHPPGFLAAISPAGRLDFGSPVRAGIEWQISGGNRLGIKKYPLCYCAHRAVDGMLDLKRRHGLKPEEVEHITVTVSSRNANIMRNHLPQNGTEAKFSVEFALASPLVADNAGLAQLDDGFVRQPLMQSLMKSVSVAIDDRPDPNRSGFSLADRICVQTRDGRQLDSGPITHVRGDPDHPLARDELWVKFEDCLRAAGSRIAARELFETLAALPALPRIDVLLRQLQAH